MTYKLGLKLWSTNTDCYYKEAKRLYNEGRFDYIELYVVPDSLDEIKIGRKSKFLLLFIVHILHMVLI